MHIAQNTNVYVLYEVGTLVGISNFLEMEWKLRLNKIRNDSLLKEVNQLDFKLKHPRYIFQAERC